MFARPCKIGVCVCVPQCGDTTQPPKAWQATWWTPTLNRTPSGNSASGNRLASHMTQRLITASVLCCFCPMTSFHSSGLGPSLSAHSYFCPITFFLSFCCLGPIAFLLLQFLSHHFNSTLFLSHPHHFNSTPVFVPLASSHSAVWGHHFNSTPIFVPSF